LRQAVDRRVGRFLRALARIRSGRVLMTTRLIPSDLEKVTGRTLPGADAWKLRGLQPADALQLWQELGVASGDPQLPKLLARIDHHPLLIRILAGGVAHHRPAPHDFTRWRLDHPDFDPFGLPRRQLPSRILQQALVGLRPDDGNVLDVLSAFPGPEGHATLEELFERKGWTPQRLDGALEALEDRGLLGWDRLAHTYDMHPLVRGVVWRGVDRQRRSAVYGDLKGLDTGADTVQRATTLFAVLVDVGRYTAAARL
jgi:hypothetical protein